MKLSAAEKNAQKATELPSLAVNLPEIRRAVQDILSTFGRNGMFSEYTLHDISHVDDMLATLVWLIPEQTAAQLTPAEWLMLTLSIYLHDLGLVVTDEEFQCRGSTGFEKFCADKLFAGAEGSDYKAKLETLSEDRRERFLYQEFVRYNHANRIRIWIEGRTVSESGVATKQAEEISRLLSGLDREFRKDLALICESHNLNDLDDVGKYMQSKPYGNSESETVNLQYCAAILRTVDLLQITSRRAPTVLYRLVAPTDPISQIEWSKQNAVKRVRAKAPADRDGNAAPGTLSDTIEVFANFTAPDGFFGLTAYLHYAQEQLRSTFNVLQRSRNAIINPPLFPWKEIDETHITVEGFIKQTFGFEIDQDKILDLLTGHTLYNNSNVVVRELTQNAIDAVRLQFKDTSGGSEANGIVRVSWNSDRSELKISDNGTGMTQEVIENHLLKVGSSRYQSSKFKEQYPDFSPISRFGIGVLSAFMVADNVEIVTVSPDETQARHISLRSVHGKYLIRLIDKGSDPLASEIGPHGTLFTLRFRPSARAIDVMETVRQYVMFPRCNVLVRIDRDGEKPVGYRSPEHALKSYIEDPRATIPGGSNTKVVEHSADGLTLAFALRYSTHFKEWLFVAAPDPRRLDRHAVLRAPVATCIEGIAVEFALPGFRSADVLAVADVRGSRAPRTNVARSSIEETDEQRRLVGAVLDLFIGAASAEADRLRRDEGYSLTWATEEIPYLLNLPVRSAFQFPDMMQEALSKVAMILVEEKGRRVAKSLNELKASSAFWTVDSVLIRSVEQFIKEAKTEVTASTLLKVSQGSSSLPDGPIVSNYYASELVRSRIASEFEVTRIEARSSERRLDMKWDIGGSLWTSRDQIRLQLLDGATSDEYAMVQSLQNLLERQNRTHQRNVNRPLSNIETAGLDGYYAVLSYGEIYILPGTPISRVLERIADGTNSPSEKLIREYIALDSLLSDAVVNYIPTDRTIERYFNQVREIVPASYIPPAQDILDAVADTGEAMRIYDPLAWSQRDSRQALII